jgi:hypothetical protein
VSLRSRAVASSEHVHGGTESASRQSHLSPVSRAALCPNRTVLALSTPTFHPGCFFCAFPSVMTTQISVYDVMIVAAAAIAGSENRTQYEPVASTPSGMAVESGTSLGERTSLQRAPLRECVCVDAGHDDGRNAGVRAAAVQAELRRTARKRALGIIDSTDCHASKTEPFSRARSSGPLAGVRLTDTLRAAP